MELIDQHTKKIMEGCKERARDVGLQFEDETLEYIVTNRDLLELTPKMMIPTLYDYWVHDVEVLKEKGKYELYPGNPYETVINTRPPISFYNDNNPDWLNVMIFYHVLAHIDFFQSNLYFCHTWEYDFCGQALSDKRVIAKLRAEKGRWVDYVIEFARGMDNLVDYHGELSRLSRPAKHDSSPLDYYFDVFLQSEIKVSQSGYIKEIKRYNDSVAEHGKLGEKTFFIELRKKYPEFDAFYRKSARKKSANRSDLLLYIMENSEKLKKEDHAWMKSVMEVVRKTALFFQPQIRTKILNEGWASYWHETLFLKDDRIKGHEVDFARVNAWVTSMPRVGLNPYALGMRLFQEVEERANRGQYSFEYTRLLNADEREKYDRQTGQGSDYIFQVRENHSDFIFINNFLDQDFINRHRLFVAGKRLNRSRMVWEYYVKSRKAEDYRQMVLQGLYHPPHLEVDPDNSLNQTLYLVHKFEEKPLVKEFINNTMLGIEYLWGGPVKMETSEMVTKKQSAPAHPLASRSAGPEEGEEEMEITWQRVLYTMENRKLSREVL